MLHISDGSSVVSPRIRIDGSTDSAINLYIATVFTGQIKAASSDVVITNVVNSDTADIIFNTKDSSERMRITGA